MDMEMDNEKEDQMDEQEHLKCMADTLLKAEEIKQDKELMGKLKPLLEKKQAALKSAVKSVSSFGELRKLASEKAAEEYDDKMKG